MREDFENTKAYTMAEAFPTLKLTENDAKVYANVHVTKIVQVSGRSLVRIYLMCDRIIEYRSIRKLEAMLQKQLFAPCGVSVEVHESFAPVEEMSFAEVWHAYRDSVEDVIIEAGIVMFNIYRTAVIEVEDNTLIIDMEDSFLAHDNAQKIADIIRHIMSDKFGMEITVLCKYHELGVKVQEDYACEMEEAIRRAQEERLRQKEKQESEDTEQATAANEQQKVVASQQKTSKKPYTREGEGSNKFYGGNAYSKAKSYKKHEPDDPDIFYGTSLEGAEVKIEDINDEIGEIVTKGKIIKCEEKETRSGKIILTFALTDFTDSITAKIFVRPEEKEDIAPHLKVGSFIRIKAMALYDEYAKEIALSSVKGIKNIPDFTTKRKDTATEKRIELHAHTMMSDMDGVVDPQALVKTAFAWGHEAVAITDHGVVQAYTEASHALDPGKMSDEDKARYKKFKIIYGCEGYIVDDEPDVVVDKKGNEFHKGPDGKYSDEDLRKMPTNHIILLCRNNTGRTNLYRMVSESHLRYYSKRPRIPKSLLKECRDGIIVGSACEAGELYQAILWNKPEEEIKRIADFYDYYEIQPIGNNAFMKEDEKIPQVQNDNDLQRLNRRIYELGKQDDKLVIATCDVHFLHPEDEVYRRIIMSAKGFPDADKQAPLYLHTTDEMLKEFSYLGEEGAREVVIDNPHIINRMIEKIAPVRPDKCPPVIENSDQTLRDICYDKAHSMYGDPLPEPVKKRLDHELESIIKNGFAVMYIIAQKLVWKSNEDGYLVGSRGSVGSSFVATMSGITEVNPLPAHYYCAKCHYSDFDSEEVKKYEASSGCDMPDKVCPVCGEMLVKDGHNIPFETFLGFNGDKEPDIDLNFSGEYQSKAHDYTEVIFGAGQTFRAGTIGAVADKTAYGYMLKYCEEHGIKRRSCEIERVSSGCVGVRRTTGQHPGGIVVLPFGEMIYSFTPVQHPANDMETKTITTHFDYHSIDHNLLKLDILGHDDPTMIRALEDFTGIDAKTIRMDDPKVLSLFYSTEALGIKPEDIDGCDLGSLGIPELGTDFVMQMLRDTKPRSFSDMIRISGLSHGTDVWLNNTQTLIADGKCTLSTAICTRDDIMTYLIQKGVEPGTAFKIMENVRKGKVAKKKCGQWDEWKEVMKEHDVPDWYMWSCERIMYMFPKAHACAYVMMAFRIAYFKVYYPLAYYAAYFGIRAKAFDYEKMCMGPEVLKKHMEEIRKKPSPTANEKDQLSDMKIVQEMYARGFEFAPIDIYKSNARTFKIEDGKILPAFSAIAGLGERAAEQIVDAASKGRFISREDFRIRCKIGQSTVDVMHELGLLEGLSESNQMSLFDIM